MIQVWYHDNCFDGFGAAWAARKKFGDDGVKYVPCQYGKPMPLHDPDDDIYIVDFSYPREDLVALKSRVKSLLVLDHHKTAAADLEGLDFAVFDMGRSGAVMTWDYFFGAETRPSLISYIGDRDLWRFAINGTREVHAYLGSWPFDFNMWDDLCTRLEALPDVIIEQGSTLLRQQQSQVERICDKAWRDTLAGHQVVVANTTIHWSEVGHELLERHRDAAFSVTMTIHKDKVQWSLRGRGDVDVSAIAKKYGGGGHPNAAGFVTPAAYFDILGGSRNADNS